MIIWIELGRIHLTKIRMIAVIVVIASSSRIGTIRASPSEKICGCGDRSCHRRHVHFSSCGLFGLCSQFAIAGLNTIFLQCDWTSNLQIKIMRQLSNCGAKWASTQLNRDSVFGCFYGWHPIYLIPMRIR